MKVEYLKVIGHGATGSDENDEFSELDNGIYRLDFKFKRDIGSNAPILKGFGFTDAEETFIEFSLIK